METNEADRRATGVRRVDFSTLVEICGREPGTPAFEAEAIELSGRGMHVRTNYLPELNAPLVLRFEHDGSEAVVEGEVAWRNKTQEGGDFGIKFTALDSKSVRVLKAIAQRPHPEPTRSKPAKDDAERDSFSAHPGSPVKLHIEGLGAPMRARVFEGKSGRVHVGSQLEFLKVGQALELEDLEAGAKCPAEIDSVTVAIDPETQIPQLVVSLKYDSNEDDEDATPEPSVVGAPEDPHTRLPIPKAHRPKKQAARTAAAVHPEEAECEEYDEDSELARAEELFKGKVASWASSAGSTMKTQSARLAAITVGITKGVGQVFGKAAHTASERATARRTPRRTSPAKGGVSVSASGVSRSNTAQRSPRTQGSSRKSKQSTEARSSAKRRGFLLAGAFALCATSVYAVFFTGGPKASISSTPVAALPPAEPSPPAAPTQAAQAVATTPSPGTFPPVATLDPAEQQKAGQKPLSANVPLFGPQQMATTEPAPLTPPPNAVDEVSMAKDQAFAQPVVPTLSKAAPASEQPEKESSAPPPSPATEDPANGEKVWQVGRMHLPIIHRLRLDGPGSAVVGSKTPTGFSVLIPGRKVMETGNAIQKRDDRILNVHVKNTPAGGKVVFRFRKTIPGYKVRLRNDYVEFFVNSKEK